MLGLGLSVTQLAVRGLRISDLAAAIRALFAANEPGVWYDPSDMSTMFQDAAGTTPVTAVEQPVGRILDKSGRGNHATQTTSTSRPVLSARVNLLTKTEDFASGWVSYDSSITANSTTAPDGTTTASSFFENAAYAEHRVLVQNLSAVGSIPYTVSACFKANGRSSGRILFYRNYDGFGASFDLATKTTAKWVIGVGVCDSTSIVSLGNGWYRVSATGKGVGPGNCIFALFTSNDSGQINYSGVATKGLYIWGADLRVANVGVGLPAYQRVNTATDYDTAGFPHYLRFDGVDDFLVTNSINFTATDKMTVFAGVRKLSDAARGMVIELGASVPAYTFQLDAPLTAGPDYLFASQGSLNSTVTATGFASPITNVLSGIGNISGDQSILRVNGTQAASSTTDQGTGKYGNYAMFIGARAGASLWFNGRIYSLVVRGAQSTEQQIIDAEKYVNDKTRAYA